VSVPDWREIVVEHSPAVWRTARRLLGNGADAEDCVQDTFVTALEASSRQQVRNWAGFLQRIATHRALDRLRDRIRRSQRHEEPGDWANVASTGPEPARRAESAELADALRRAVAELPAQQAEVFSLREFSDLSYGEIAEELGISPSTAGVVLHRARGRLAEMLAPHGPGQEARCVDVRTRTHSQG